MAVTAESGSAAQLGEFKQLQGSFHTYDECQNVMTRPENGIGPVHSLNDDSCDACAYCDDTCGNHQCVSCSVKIEKTKNSSNDMEGKGFPLGGIFGDGCAGECSENSYTMCQVRRHCTADSAWLLVGDTIYDATSYISCHPGGKNSILKKSGGACDCTEDMNFHSRNAKRMWKKYKVGKVRKCVSDSDDFGSDEQCTIS